MMMLVLPLSYIVIFLVILFNVASLVVIPATTRNVGIVMARLQHRTTKTASAIVITSTRVVIGRTLPLRGMSHPGHEGFQALGSELLKLLKFAWMRSRLCVSDLPH